MTRKLPSEARAAENLPVPPQPSALQIRDVSQRMLGNLAEVLTDHIALFHQSPEAAKAALDFTVDLLRKNIDKRMKELERYKDHG